MPLLVFGELWNSHPVTNGEIAPCKKKDGTSAFDNQCAIRMGIALAGAGVSLKGYTGAKCWFSHNGTHTLRVEEMISWLKVQTGIFGKAVRYKGKQPDLGWKIKREIAGKSGIVAWRNFWGQGNQGDHIDLWNGTAIRHGELEYFDRSEDMYFWQIA